MKLTIQNLMQSKQEQLESSLSIIIEHGPTKGSHCEEEWIGFFEMFLPSRYAVTKGFIIDAFGGVSDQIDIIIYDALYAPLIFETKSKDKYVSAESVYAVFECKQKISKENIEYANDKIDSVRKLHRGKRGIVFGGKSMKSRELTKIIGGILAADAVGFETLKIHLSKNKNIDLGCAIKEYSFLAQRDIKQNLTGCINSSKEEAILSFFYIILDELYKIGTVAALDIRDYADASLTSLQLEREEE